MRQAPSEKCTEHNQSNALTSFEFFGPIAIPSEHMKLMALIPIVSIYAKTSSFPEFYGEMGKKFCLPRKILYLGSLTLPK